MKCSGPVRGRQVNVGPVLEKVMRYGHVTLGGRLHERQAAISGLVHLVAQEHERLDLGQVASASCHREVRALPARRRAGARRRQLVGGADAPEQH